MAAIVTAVGITVSACTTDVSEPATQDAASATATTETPDAGATEIAEPDAVAETTTDPAGSGSPSDVAEHDGTEPEASETDPSVSEPFEPGPFEREPTTPVQEGVDIEDILRETSSTTTTTIAPDASQPPVAALEPGPLAWTLRSSLDGSATQLHLLVDEGGCDGTTDLDDRLVLTVVESSTTVRLGVERTDSVGIDREPCPTAPLTPTIAELAAPLGERALVALDTSVLPIRQQAVAEPVVVKASTTAAPVVPATTVSVGDSDALASLVRLGCTGPTATARDWQPTTEFASAEIGLADGATALDRIDAPWHEVRLAGDDATDAHWLLLTDGRVQAHLDARRGVAGLRFSGAVCADASNAPDVFDTTVTPDFSSGESAQAAPLLDLSATPGAANFASASAEQLEFPDPSARCAAWIEWEDALLDGGYSLGAASLGVDAASLATATARSVTSLPRQTIRRLDAPDGSAAIVITRADGTVTIEAAPPRDAGADRASRLAPCELDATIDVLIR